MDELSELGGRVSTSDNVLFLWHQNNIIIGMLMILLAVVQLHLDQMLLKQ